MALLLESLRHVDKAKFRGVIFRRDSNQIKNPGGLWDASVNLYPFLKGHGTRSATSWQFPSGAKIKFSHMCEELDYLKWQGSELDFIGYDELTHFSEAQFKYMFSRSRSTSGIKPYIRATTNPDSTSWVRKYIDWWIDPESGFAIDERSGVLRYFVNQSDEIYWASSAQELIDQFPDSIPKSLTFIKSSLSDNKILMEADPSYLANLKSLSRVERERLLGGNWNIKPTTGLYFQKHYFEVIKVIPKSKIVKKVRYWDRAATKKTEENDPDWTVGIRAELDENGVIYITDMVRIRESALTVQNAIKNTAAQDGRSVFIGIEQDPGQAGKVEAEFLIRMLGGYIPKAYTVHKDKITRCLPMSAQAEAGNVKLLYGIWNDEFLREVENFPDDAHDDIVDALSGAHLMLHENTYNFAAMARI